MPTHLVGDGASHTGQGGGGRVRENTLEHIHGEGWKLAKAIKKGHIVRLKLKRGKH